jgi:hypothetical protein
MKHLRSLGWMVASIGIAAHCGSTTTAPGDGAVATGDAERETGRDTVADRAVSAPDGARGNADTHGDEVAAARGPDGADVPASTSPVPLLDCFGPHVTGCAHGVLESPVALYWDGPQGRGPRFVPSQAAVTVRPDGEARLGAGTLCFWARHFDPLEAGQTHVLAQIAMVDGRGQVDANNRIHVLFRDGNLEGLVAQDTLQVGPLGQSAEWERDAIAPGEWHQYALSWDDREMCLFVDGGLLARKPRSSPAGMTATFPRVYLGARFDGTFAADSQIAHVLLWGQRLTHPDIQRMFNADLQQAKLPVVVQAAVANTTPSSRVEIPWASVLPDLDFHLTSAVKIGPRARVVIAFPHSNGEFFANPPWNVTVDLPKGVTASAGCAPAPRLPLAKVCTLVIADGTIAPSTDIVVRLADVPLGGKVTINRKGGSNVWPQVFVDCGGDEPCSGALLPVAVQPSLAFVPPPDDQRAAVFARTPSTVRVGEPFSLRLWAEKADSAPDLGAAFAVSFTAVPELSGLPASYPFVAGDDGGAEIAGLAFTALPSAGHPVSLVGTTNAGEVIDINPVEVSAPSSSPRLFWGDLHLHSTFSDGKELPGTLYPFARSRGLDFAAITDHINTGDVYAAPWEFNHTMAAADWQELQTLARTHNVRGSFVTLLGFEASAGSIKELGDCLNQGASRCPMTEGDWNTYFSTDSAPLLDSNTVFASDGLLSTLDLVDPLAMVIPHFGGRRADLLAITPDQNRARIPLVEIISNHTGPPTGAEGWAIQTIPSAVRLGFIGSSDDHSGHPGRSMWGTRYGYVAVWAESLDRAAILDALRRRHSYACSHADRPIVKSSANHGAMMGDSVTLPEGEDPAMLLTVDSQNQVSAVTLLRDGAQVWQTAPASATSSAPYSVSVPYAQPLPKSPTSYYWRITFANTAVVWTSPIWFERQSPSP